MVALESASVTIILMNCRLWELRVLAAGEIREGFDHIESSKAENQGERHCNCRQDGINFSVHFLSLPDVVIIFPVVLRAYNHTALLL